MNLKQLAIIIGTIIIIAIILTGLGGNITAAISGMLLVFVLPGYAMVKMLFPENHLETGEFVALTLGLSLAIAAIGGLILQWLPWKQETYSWTVLLGSITFFASIAALLRQRHLKIHPPSFTKVNISLSFNDGLIFVLAGVGVMIAFILAYKGEVIQNSADFTQLWITPGQQSNSTVQVGINNRTAEMIQYRLLLKVNDEVVDETSPIDLDSDETWKYTYNLPEGADSVSAELYRLYAPAEMCNGEYPPDICQQNDEVYREVFLK